MVITDDPIYGEIVSAYLLDKGVEVIVLSSETPIEQLLSCCTGIKTAILLTPDTAILHDVIVETGVANATKIVQLVRRRSSSSSGKSITVAVNPLLYHDLIQGVAIACGLLDTQAAMSIGEHRQYPRARPKTPDPDEAAASGRLILLAEDNETNQEVIQGQLHLLGYACEVAADGLEALRKWRLGRYALLLTDCHMPNMDGFQLTTAIRQEETAGDHFPIVAVTANAIQGEAERCMENGMDDYLSKPLRLDELGAMLAKWLPQPAEIAVARFGSNNVSTNDNSPAVVWDPTTLPRMMGGDTAMHRRVLDKFLLSAEEMLAAISDAEAVGEPGVIADVAHKFKSASRTVGAMILGDICQQLETTGRTGDMQAIMTLIEKAHEAFQSAREQIRKG